MVEIRPFRLIFKCPICEQRVRPNKDGTLRFECKHKGTPKEKGMLSDPDRFLIDEVIIKKDHKGGK